ncbi:hypothetical protein LMH87_010936 [Akanthomyces muscarius]|uniref:Uncharacterized protein n=1 Tax=Akanthomyces muscarius TaxID=2231603 RepID=A0A9W8QAS2_AKAMU|nr:hypothetical protein LMH87_010936 [Akanthomyces muscarius]KAJ4150173.1 hypothetical protein LMH87_010936 [Akanthomyces muscarius]
MRSSIRHAERRGPGRDVAQLQASHTYLRQLTLHCIYTWAPSSRPYADDGMCVLSCSPSVFYRSCDLQVMVLSCKSAVIDHPKAVFRQLDGKQLKLAVNGASFAVTTITHWAPAEREALDSLLATLTFLGFAVGRRKGGSWLFNRAAAAAGMPPHIVMPDICSGVDWCREIARQQEDGTDYDFCTELSHTVVRCASPADLSLGKLLCLLTIKSEFCLFEKTR